MAAQPAGVPTTPPSLVSAESRLVYSIKEKPKRQNNVPRRGEGFTSPLALPRRKPRLVAVRRLLRPKPQRQRFPRARGGSGHVSSWGAAQRRGGGVEQPPTPRCHRLGAPAPRPPTRRARFPVRSPLTGALGWCWGSRSAARGRRGRGLAAGGSAVAASARAAPSRPSPAGAAGASRALMCRKFCFGTTGLKRINPL